MVNPLSLENFWISRRKFEDAERIFYEAKYGGNQRMASKRNGSLTNGPQLKSKVTVELDKVRTYIKQSLSVSGQLLVLNERYNKLVKEKATLTKNINDLRNAISKLEVRVNGLEKSGSKPQAAAKSAEPAKKKDDDDDIDLFGSDEEEDPEVERAREERAKAAAEKKQKKGLIAKSSVLLDIKPWDDETDLQAMEKSVRSIEMDGLLWGKSEFKPVAFGVKKLTIVCVVEDDKVSLDELQEKIESFEDFVQSVDIVAFQKI